MSEFVDLIVDDEDDELRPYEKPYRFENWDREDLVMYVGGDRSLYL